jgi:dipeptide transport system ATP-binding protein
MMKINNLSVEFETQRGQVPALRDVSLSVAPGEAVGIVGESGSGKSVTSLAIMGLLPANAKVTSGSILFPNERKVAMIFQDPMTSLNPAFNVEFQIGEALRIHQKIPRRLWREKVLYYLNLVGIPDAESRLSAYPHQLSGGMAQRVIIALAMACEPKLLIADEPTTALDVTIQAQVLSLLRDLQKSRSLSMLLISHDMGVIAQNTSRVNVMYAGEIVEEGLTADVIKNPLHPYTQALLSCLPSRQLVESDHSRLPSIPGVVPDLLHRPPGCQFQPRCPKAIEECVRPQVLRSVQNRLVRCCRA